MFALAHIKKKLQKEPQNQMINYYFSFNSLGSHLEFKFRSFYDHEEMMINSLVFQ